MTQFSYGPNIKYFNLRDPTPMLRHFKHKWYHIMPWQTEFISIIFDKYVSGGGKLVPPYPG